MPATPEQDQILPMLMPLHFFYERVGRVLPEIQFIDPVDVPEPHHSLLVHERDMTSTLAQFHESAIDLDVRSRESDGDHLLREVILRRKIDRVAVEYGAIEIRPEKFEAPLREKIVNGDAPLGELIETYSIDYRSEPRGFFRVVADEPLASALEVVEGTELYGRSNELKCTDGFVFADVIEVLP